MCKVLSQPLSSVIIKIMIARMSISCDKYPLKHTLFADGFDLLIYILDKNSLQMPLSYSSLLKVLQHNCFSRVKGFLVISGFGLTLGIFSYLKTY